MVEMILQVEVARLVGCQGFAGMRVLLIAMIFKFKMKAISQDRDIFGTVEASSFAWSL